MPRHESDDGDVWYSHKVGDEYCRGMWCEYHELPLGKKTKGAQTWFSHKYIDTDGTEKYCKGLPAA